MPRVIVAAAVVRDGRLLAARRVGPPELAGRWELPGGKVEPGEDPVAALHRELDEELGLRVLLGERVGDEWPLPEGAVMAVWGATPMTSAEVAPGHAHDAILWLKADELDSVPWLDADLALLPGLARLLAAHAR